MIVGAAVCPGAPFLLDGPADALARRASDVVAACRTAVAALRDADAVLLLSTGRSGATRGGTVTGGAAPTWARVLPPGTRLGAPGVHRSDWCRQPELTLPTGPATGVDPARVSDPAVGTVVGAWLLAAAGIDAPVTAVELAAGGSDATTVLTGLSALTNAGDRNAGDRTADGPRIGILVIADGAACHGDFAPGKRNDAAGPFDCAVADALEAGDPGGLARACGDRRSAQDLLATVEPLAALAELTAGHPPDRAGLLFAGAPFGVGYFVSLWQWS